MGVEFISNAFIIWAQLLVFPFSSPDLLWRMIPIYLNGVLISIYSDKPSYQGAIFGGAVAILAGIDWIRSFNSGDVSALNINWIIAIGFLVYGGFSVLVGFFKREKFYFIFGRRSILTFFAISFYPIQTGYIYSLDGITLGSIFFVAIPIILVFEFITRILGKILNRKNIESSSFK